VVVVPTAAAAGVNRRRHASSLVHKGRKVETGVFIVEPNHEQLIQIGDLMDAGHLHAVVDAALPFAQASAGSRGRGGTKRGRGKLVVAVATQQSSR
jgi:NADPH:quinone reductase-like Zn-dependent oxidoreductase